MAATLHETWADALVDDEPDFDVDAEPIDMTHEADALAQADRYLRYLRVLASDRALIVDVYEAEITRLQERRDAQLATIDAAAERYSGPVRDLHRALREKDDRRKTIKLPNGTLKSTAGQPGWEVDPTTFVPWAQENERTELLHDPKPPAPDKKAIKDALQPHPSMAEWKDDGISEAPEFAALTDDGQVVPGVTVTPADVTYDIKVGEDD
jgi:hypothetical protein